MIKNRVGNTFLIDWRKIKPLQPDNAKEIFNYKHIEDSILKYGFSQPFYVWKFDKEYYCIDGHTRNEVLHNLGEQVPNKLPATEIFAENRKEAIEILIDVYNQKHNPFNSEVLQEFIEIEQVEVNIESVNIMVESVDFDNIDGNQDRSKPDNSKFVECPNCNTNFKI